MGAVALSVFLALLAGCASARLEPRAFTEEEKVKVDAVLMPLIAASGICRPKEACPIGLGVLPRRRIEVAVGPLPPNKFGLEISIGALRDLQPPELQAALAHEIGHVQLGHLDNREARSQPGQAGDTAAAADKDQRLRRSRAYDREEEFAADRYAAALLERLPGSPGHGCAEMLLLLERLDLEQLSPGWTHWLSTHPTPAARLQALQAECDKKP